MLVELAFINSGGEEYGRGIRHRGSITMKDNMKTGIGGKGRRFA